MTSWRRTDEEVDYDGFENDEECELREIDDDDWDPEINDPWKNYSEGNALDDDDEYSERDDYYLPFELTTGDKFPYKRTLQAISIRTVPASDRVAEHMVLEVREAGSSISETNPVGFVPTYIWVFRPSMHHPSLSGQFYFEDMAAYRGVGRLRVNTIATFTLFDQVSRNAARHAIIVRVD